MNNKNLLSFAHYGEAQFFLSQLSFKKSSEIDGLFEGETCDLLITGEGMTSVLYLMTRVLSLKGQGYYQRCLNFGVVGSLSSKLKIQDVFQVRSVYQLIDQSLQFTSFTCQPILNLKFFDLVTAQTRVLDPQTKREISGFGDAIDRELWAVAFVCHQMRLPWQSIKVVSDEVHDATSCSAVLEQKDIFAELLWSAYQRLIAPQFKVLASQSSSARSDLRGKLESFLDHPQFYWTESLKNEFNSRVSTIKGEQAHSLIESEAKKLLNDISLAPKVRAIKLVDSLRVASNPLMFEYRKKRQEIVTKWAERGIQITFDPKGEQLALNFKFSAATQLGLKNKIQVLNHFIEGENLDQL